MKKKTLSMVLMCMMGMNAHAQVYAGDTWMQMPTTDLYDTNVMNMHLRALAETAARREAAFDMYSNKATEAFKARRWNYVIFYVNEALDTKYYNGYVYYLRGYAYEQLGNERAAKKDYKKGKKYNSYQAVSALNALNEKQKQKRKK